MYNFINLNFDVENELDVDKEKILLYFNEVKNILHINKNIKSLILTGYMALVAASGRAYRNPNDIDFLISPSEILSFLKNMQNQYDWCITDPPRGNQAFLLKSFLNGEFKKFASPSFEGCQCKIHEASVFTFKNKKPCLLFQSENTCKKNKLLLGFQPDWVYHDPSKESFLGKFFFEEFGDFFKIGFFTKKDIPNFSSCLLFFNQNESKEPIICNFLCDVSNDICYWQSPFLQKKEFENFNYKIMVFLNNYNIYLKNKISGTVLDIWLTGGETREIAFADEILNVNICSFFKKNWNRKKDSKDLTFYNDLFSLEKDDNKTLIYLAKNHLHINK